MRRIGSFVALVVISLSLGWACQPAGSPANTPSLVIVKGSLNTTANNGPGQSINIDATGGTAALPFGKVKRYTITLQTAQLWKAPAGVDKIAVFVGVLTGTTAAADVGVILQDPATASPFLHSGMTVLPYAGTNSYIKVIRGADGLGPVEIQFNAYVEVEP